MRIAFFLLVLLSTCSKKNQPAQNQEQQKPVSEIAENEGVARGTQSEKLADNDFHYVVNLKFEGDKISISEISKGEGELPLRIIPTSQFFLLIIENDMITHYHQFPNPRVTHTTVQEGKTTNEEIGYANILLPAWLSEKEAEGLSIAIYQPQKYIADFEKLVANAESIDTAKKRGIIKAIYQFEEKEIILKLRF